MIQIKNLFKIFQTSEIETYALNDINFTINDGDYISIMGPSGCGKSTFLNILGLLDEPSSGEILFDKENVSFLNDSHKANIRNEKIGFIFQDFHLIPSLNILDNVILPLSFNKNNKLSFEEQKKKGIEILKRVGLEHRIKHFPAQLSGGQCQRAAIARALITSPKIILADEPTGNLDSKVSLEITNLISELNANGVTVVMVTHDEKIALKAKTVLHMLDGKLVL